MQRFFCDFEDSLCPMIIDQELEMWQKTGAASTQMIVDNTLGLGKLIVCL